MILVILIESSLLKKGEDSFSGLKIRNHIMITMRDLLLFLIYNYVIYYNSNLSIIFFKNVESENF